MWLYSGILLNVHFSCINSAIYTHTERIKKKNTYTAQAVLPAIPFTEIMPQRRYKMKNLYLLWSQLNLTLSESNSAHCIYSWYSNIWPSIFPYNLAANVCQLLHLALTQRPITFSSAGGKIGYAGAHCEVVYLYLTWCDYDYAVFA